MISIQVHPDRVIQLIRYLQFLVEYLLKVQSHLASLSQDNRRAAEQYSREVKDLKSTLTLRDQQLLNLKETHRIERKAAEAATSSIEKKNSNQLEQREGSKGVIHLEKFLCKHCHAAFKTENYLKSHIERRHGGISAQIHDLQEFIRDQFHAQRGQLSHDIEKYIDSALSKALENVVGSTLSVWEPCREVGVVGGLQKDQVPSKECGKNEIVPRINHEFKVTSNSAFYECQLFQSLEIEMKGPFSRARFYRMLAGRAPEVHVEGIRETEDEREVVIRVFQLMAEQTMDFDSGRDDENDLLKESEFRLVMRALSANCYENIKSIEDDALDPRTVQSVLYYILPDLKEHEFTKLIRSGDNIESEFCGEKFYECVCKSTYVNLMGGSVMPILARLAYLAYSNNALGAIIEAFNRNTSLP
mmetsp:Transcript_1584/g.2257  ORF Transcript_1584/g.2257 Transcript_1584/m.2257 type:complete len:416 (-) Transcript_1584:96-1343(-)